MDLLTFIVEISKALAWPLASILIALVFRGQISELSRRVKKGKIGPAEFEFEQSLKELKQRINLNDSDESPSFSITVDKDDWSQIEKPIPAPSPRDQVLNAWLQVEEFARGLAEKRGIQGGELNTKRIEIVHLIRKLHLLSPESTEALPVLLRLRNEAAHEVNFNPSTESLSTYIKLAAVVASDIKNLLSNEP